jgi:hypothetical protein
MSDTAAPAPERTLGTLGTIFKDLTADLSMLVRSEIALLKLEIRESLAKVGGGAALFAAALFLALVGLAFLFVTITLGLIALGVPAWLSALLVTLTLFAAAGVLAFLGRKKMEQVRFVPNESIEHIRSDIEMSELEEKQVIERTIVHARNGVGDRIDELDRHLRINLDPKSLASSWAPQLIAGGAVLGVIVGFGMPRVFRKLVTWGVPITILAMTLKNAREKSREAEERGAQRTEG